MREGKGTTFDGGQRVPFIAWWPGQISADSVCRDVAVTFDLLPTLAGLAGAALDPGRTIDGKDIWPLLHGAAGAASPHEAFFFHLGGRVHAVRCGNWKLHAPHQYRSLAGKGGGGWPGPYENKDIGWALFDLEADIGETTDVADQHPGIVERLKGLIVAFEKELADNARPPGRI